MIPRVLGLCTRPNGDGDCPPPPIPRHPGHSLIRTQGSGTPTDWLCMDGHWWGGFAATRLLRQNLESRVSVSLGKGAAVLLRRAPDSGESPACHSGCTHVGGVEVQVTKTLSYGSAKTPVHCTGSSPRPSVPRLASRTRSNASQTAAASELPPGVGGGEGGCVPPRFLGPPPHFLTPRVGWDLRICISSKPPADADSAGLGTPL